jgi:selenocysteine-specific elongation factor
MPLHVHSGAAHLTARAVPLEPATIAPGTTGLAQLVLSAPTLLVQGDILVLRDTSASRTVGRARVLDARAPARRRRTPHRLAVLEALRATDVAERLRCLVEMTPTGVDLAVFARDANLRESECPAPEPDWRVVDDGGARRAFAARHWKASSERAVAALAGFHAREPDRLGPDGARFRRLCLPEATPETAAAMVRAWVREGVLAQSGPWLHLPGHTVALTEAERRVFRVLASLIASGNYDPPWVRSLAAEIRLEEAQVRRLLVKAARLGELHQVVKDLFYAPPVIARLAGLVNDIAAREGVVRAADFRDATGLGRKRAIQILEYFDRVGFTRRIRDDHVVRDARMFEPAEARAA